MGFVQDSLTIRCPARAEKPTTAAGLVRSTIHAYDAWLTLPMPFVTCTVKR
jgi:hypothetical protein